ncbi:hypothetical protein JTE90_020347 [Oedothorax gibbosus]|uniref:Uncharacterized protein n=1 Tax=Oedothorax gibbosus TaxID=931172 RepID=A0AAV6TCR7_9ARAC|nr:hypothetical protein JTE90_020347 [Oedothorax gibbosus]
MAKPFFLTKPFFGPQGDRLAPPCLGREAVRTGPCLPPGGLPEGGRRSRGGGLGTDSSPFIDEVPWAAVSSSSPTRKGPVPHTGGAARHALRGKSGGRRTYRSGVGYNCS